MSITHHILSPDSILINLSMYQTKIDDPLADDPKLIIEQAIEAENIMVNSGKMLADAKYWLREAMHSETIRTLKELVKSEKIITSTSVNEIIKSLCKEQNYIVDWCERVNRSATHRIELCRTIISKHKAEMQNKIEG